MGVVDLYYSDPDAGSDKALTHELYNDGTDHHIPHVIVGDGAGGKVPVSATDGLSVKVQSWNASASLPAGTNVVGKVNIQGQAIDGANLQDVSVVEHNEERLSTISGIVPLGVRRDSPGTWASDDHTAALTLSSRGALWIAIDGSLASGTNRIGGVAMDVEKVQHGSSQIDIKSKCIKVSGNSETELIAAVGGKKIRVHGIFFATTVATVTSIKSNSTNIGEDMAVTTFGQYGGNLFPGFWFETVAGEALKAQAASASAAINYTIFYSEV